MKVKFEDMRKFVKILKSVPYFNEGDHTVFIPVDSQFKKENFANEGEPLVLFESRSDTPSYSKYVMPGFILGAPDEDGKVNSIRFGYVTTEYSIPFNMEEYIYLQNFKVTLKKEDKALLYGADYFIVPNKGILMNFPWDK